MNVVQPTSTADRITSLLRVHTHTVFDKLCNTLLCGGDGILDNGGAGNALSFNGAGAGFAFALPGGG